jgi:formylglycine-generating enzyme required for sulfatase activity
MILCAIFFFAIIKPKPTPDVRLNEATRTRRPDTSITQSPDLSAVPPSVTPHDAVASPGPGELPPACTKIGQRWTSPKDSAIMLCVPAGEFNMGSDISDPDAQANEMPQHTVSLDAYWIDHTEVTNAMYARCVSAGVCIAPANTGSATRKTYYGDPTFDNYPVIYISQKDAQAYCQWRWARLPTEAEWEKAARGADGRLYPWGDTFDGRFLNFCDSNCTRRDPNPEYNDGYVDTAPVGAYPSGASPYGLLDMAGNVWEMVMDWYSQTYYTSSPRQNPTGPYMGDAYVMRGGAWDSRQNIVRAAVRYTIQPGAILDYVGFRCAASP